MLTLPSWKSAPARLAGLILAVSLSLMATGCSRAAEDPAFGAKVRAYLLAHPEVIEEAVQALQDKREAEAAQAVAKAMAKAKTALQHDPALRTALERDPRDFVANPGGKITVTEFYDYRCPHCINAAPKVLSLIQENPDVRFVFKEMPIFGATSEYAARAAIAIKTAGADYVSGYRQMMETHPLDDAAVDRIVQGLGLDPAKAQAGAAKTVADAQIKDVHTLANKLAIDGTPTFVIGDTVVPGEDMDAVKAAIFTAREGGQKAS
jgi:protein-disulfide isomerase